MNVLALDTATSDAAVALATPAGIATRGIAWRRAFREGAPAAGALLTGAGLGWRDLDGVAIPSGPGSFTGLRVGASLALGFCSLADVPLHAVPTLVAVAEAFAPAGVGRACPVLDARRGRRYAARVARTEDGWTQEAGPFDLAPEAVADLAGDAPLVEPPPDVAADGAVARALARLVAARPEPWRLASPDRLVLTYARSGVDHG